MSTRAAHHAWLGAARRTVASALALVSVVVAVPARAQNTPESLSLDTFILQRFRGAQLLPDSNPRAVPVGVSTVAPRIESARKAGRRDTVVAIQFDSINWRATLATGTAVQLADPTGAITALTARVTARRAFRAPRKPGARDTLKTDWRMGWAYLVAIPQRSANAAPAGFDGWLLYEPPRKTPAKASR